MILGHLRNKNTFSNPLPHSCSGPKRKSQPELLFHEIRQLGGPLVACLSVFHLGTEQRGALVKIHPVATDGSLTFSQRLSALLEKFYLVTLIINMINIKK